MANHLQRADAERLPLQSYSTVRPDLKSGDLLFASGNYTISQLIRRFTKSAWSHVGIVFKIDAIGRVLLLESVPCPSSHAPVLSNAK